ncbi:hypothetical protein BDV06DRAFT_119651 [Aspergillus oleicola]
MHTILNRARTPGDEIHCCRHLYLGATQTSSLTSHAYNFRFLYYLLICFTFTFFCLLLSFFCFSALPFSGYTAEYLLASSFMHGVLASSNFGSNIFFYSRFLTLDFGAYAYSRLRSGLTDHGGILDLLNCLFL